MDVDANESHSHLGDLHRDHCLCLRDTSPKLWSLLWLSVSIQLLHGFMSSCISIPVFTHGSAPSALPTRSGWGIRRLKSSPWHINAPSPLHHAPHPHPQPQPHHALQRPPACPGCTPGSLAPPCWMEETMDRLSKSSLPQLFFMSLSFKASPFFSFFFAPNPGFLWL